MSKDDSPLGSAQTPSGAVEPVTSDESAEVPVSGVGRAEETRLSSHRVFVLLRYTLIIATAYLALAEGGFAAPPPYIVLLLAGALATNVFLAWLPAHLITSPYVRGAVILGDTAWITAVLLRTTEVRSELLFLYFFVVLLAGIGESLQLIVIGTLVVCAGYLYVLSVGGGPSPWSTQALMRVMFLFTVAIFYAYLTDRIRQLRRLAHSRAHMVTRLERAREALVNEVAERKRAQEEIRASEEKYRGLVEDMKDVVYAVDREGNITYASPAVEALLGISPEELIGRHFSAFILPEDLSRLTDVFSASLVSEQQLFAGVHRVVTKLGEIRWVHSRGRLTLHDGQVTGMRGMTSDITNQRRLEQEILNISEEEQRRIGRDLHDGLGQDLTGIGFATRALERRLRSRAVDDWSEASRIAELVNEAIDKTRALARGLNPVEIGENGLPVALKGLADATTRVFHVPCTFNSPPSPLVLPQEIAMHLYRIAQEAVHNAIKHGRPQRVRIDLSRSDDRLALEVADDGCGFSNASSTAGGLGVRIMQYRAEMIGADLHVRSREGDGTSVQCSLALGDPEQARTGHTRNGRATID